MQRKVDIMNGKTPQATPQKDDKGVVKKEEAAPKKAKQEDYAKRALIMFLFVITVTMGYILEDGPFKIWILGITVVAVFHVYALWVAFYEKRISDSTIMLAKVWFGIVILGVFFSVPMWQAWEQTKNTVTGLNQPYGKASAVADSGESQSQAKGRWMKFDSDVYELANPNDPEGIIVDNPEEWIPLPKVPTGYRFNVYCDEAALKIYWKGGPQYGRELKCGEKFGENLDDLLITVSPNTDDPATISVWLEPLH